MNANVGSRRKKTEENASAGNRARVTSMATMYSTTRPLMQIQVGHQSSLTHGKAHLGLSHPHGVLQVAGCTSTLTTATGVVVVWLP